MHAFSLLNACDTRCVTLACACNLTSLCQMMADDAEFAAALEAQEQAELLAMIAQDAD
jgi:hypothetical protein